MNQAFIELLEAARTVADRAATSPKLSSGDMCVDAKLIQALELAVRTAENVQKTTSTPTEQQLSSCQSWLWAHGRGYPRTCATCGLMGPCRFNQPPIR